MTSIIIIIEELKYDTRNYFIFSKLFIKNQEFIFSMVKKNEKYKSQIKIEMVSSLYLSIQGI
jgi:hypothetical protein